MDNTYIVYLIYFTQYVENCRTESKHEITV